jgi:polysaccharide biosynthesis/export protein
MLAGLVSCLACLPGCGVSSSSDFAAKAPAPTGAMSAENSSYSIGPGDTLDISVFNVPELTKTVQVSENGSINLPLVGEIAVGGKSAREIERDLTKKLGAKYLKSPQVTVLVKEYNSQRATIDGAIKKPGVYPLRGKMTLLQMIATADGLDKEVASSEAIILRQIDGEKTAARFNIDEIRSGQTDDPIIRQGDMIVVDTSASKVAFQNFMKVLPIAALTSAFVAY